jgi:hypothetical protein
MFLKMPGYTVNLKYVIRTHKSVFEHVNVM